LGQENRPFEANQPLISYVLLKKKENIEAKWKWHDGPFQTFVEYNVNGFSVVMLCIQPNPWSQLWGTHENCEPDKVLQNYGVNFLEGINYK
jgi:hypothetical protein